MLVSANKSRYNSAEECMPHEHEVVSSNLAIDIFFIINLFLIIIQISKKCEYKYNNKYRFYIYNVKERYT